MADYVILDTDLAGADPDGELVVESVPIMSSAYVPPEEDDVSPSDSGDEDDGVLLLPDDPGEPTGCGATWCCHPHKSGHKILALSLMCLLGFGSYFCFDNPGALQEEIKDVMGVSTLQFANLYSFYSWPNVVLPIVGGYLLDSLLGLRRGAAIFAFTLILGQSLFALGGYMDVFGLMYAGRFLFGVGGESLAVAQNTYTAAWFTGSALNMVFGLQLSIARLGSTANFQVVGPLYHYFRATMEKNPALGSTLFLAGLSCVMSFVAAVILGCIDYRRERILRKTNTAPPSETTNSIHLSEICHFPATFWLLCIICVSYYVAIFPFVSLGQTFFERKFSMDPAQANFINGLIYLISAFASPAFGLGIDLIGRNILCVFAAVVATLTGHMMLAMSFITPYVAVIITGIAYSLLASALWPMVTYIVPNEQLGTAYGIMQAVQNLGLGVVSLVAGGIVDWKGYFAMEVYFIACLIVAAIATVALLVVDYQGTRILNISARARALAARQSCQTTENEP